MRAELKTKQDEGTLVANGVEMYKMDRQIKTEIKRASEREREGE